MLTNQVDPAGCKKSLYGARPKFLQEAGFQNFTIHNFNMTIRPVNPNPGHSKVLNKPVSFA